MCVRAWSPGSYGGTVPRRLRTVLAAMKVRGMSVYANGGGQVAPHQLDAAGHHSALSGGGNLRAAVFGVNDGLISNASLILGVAGAKRKMRRYY